MSVFDVMSRCIENRKRVVWWSDRFVTITTADWLIGKVVLLE